MVTSQSRTVSPYFSPTMPSGMILAIVAKRGTSDLVGSGKTLVALGLGGRRHGDFAVETTAVDSSVDPSSQSMVSFVLGDVS